MVDFLKKLLVDTKFDVHFYQDERKLFRLLEHVLNMKTIFLDLQSNSPWEPIRDTKTENPTRNEDAQRENAMTERNGLFTQNWLTSVGNVSSG